MGSTIVRSTNSVYLYYATMLSKGVIVKEIRVDRKTFENYCQLKGARHYKFTFPYKNIYKNVILTRK